MSELRREEKRLLHYMGLTCWLLLEPDEEQRRTATYNDSRRLVRQQLAEALRDLGYDMEEM